MTRLWLFLALLIGAASAIASEPTGSKLPPPPQFDLKDAEEMTAFAVISGDRIRLVSDAGAFDVSLWGIALPSTMDDGLLNPTRAVADGGIRKLVESELVRIKGTLLPGDVSKVNLFRASDGLWLNLEIVRQGFGSVDVVQAGENAELFSAYETHAKKLGKGIWAPKPVKPAAKPVAVAPRPLSTTSPSPTASNTPKDSDSQSDTVFVTQTGTKYHRAGCSYLKSSSIAMSLADAQAKYSPCSRCHPAISSATPNTPAVTPSSDTSSAPASVVPSDDRVHVRGYYRKDGTYVQPHTRSKPRK
ncbi:MAG: hypothetical protein ACREJD_03025 [Phycisphaerales bacterium]